MRLSVSLWIDVPSEVNGQPVTEEHVEDWIAFQLRASYILDKNPLLDSEPTVIRSSIIVMEKIS
jgi:hypothetical protein